MFYGESTHAMDAKGRVHVPKRFLDALPREADDTQAVFLTLGLEGCLFLFSTEGFARALERLETQTFAGPKTRAMQRAFFSKASRQTLDANGRLVIPENLRTKVGLGKELVMVGLIERAEIWPRESWEQVEAENDENWPLLDEVLCPEKGSRPA